MQGISADASLREECLNRGKSEELHRTFGFIYSGLLIGSGSAYFMGEASTDKGYAKRIKRLSKLRKKLKTRVTALLQTGSRFSLVDSRRLGTVELYK